MQDYQPPGLVRPFWGGAQRRREGGTAPIRRCSVLFPRDDESSRTFSSAAVGRNFTTSLRSEGRIEQVVDWILFIELLVRSQKSANLVSSGDFTYNDYY